MRVSVLNSILRTHHSTYFVVLNKIFFTTMSPLRAFNFWLFVWYWCGIPTYLPTYLPTIHRLNHTHQNRHGRQCLLTRLANTNDEMVVAEYIMCLDNVSFLWLSNGSDGSFVCVFYWHKWNLILLL